MTMTPRLRMASILLLTFIVFSCYRPGDGMKQGPKAVITLMDSAECIMDDNPAYADSLMRSIDPSSILTPKQRARYALLYTAAEYRNYQTFNNDSLIMEAVQYYSIRNNIDYRFLSYYYLGCVYLELNQLSDASLAFSHAELLVDKIDKNFWKGLLYSHLAYLFEKSCLFNRAVDYYDIAIDFYEKAGKDHHKMHCLVNLANCEFYMRHFDIADSILYNVQKWGSVNNDDKVLDLVIYPRFFNFVLTDKMDSATILFDSYKSYIEERTINKPSNNSLLALYYYHINDPINAELCLNVARDFINSRIDSIYWYYYQYRIAEIQNNVNDVLKYHVKFKELENKDIISDLMQPVLSAQNDYFHRLIELESDKARNRKTILIAFVLLFTLILTLILYLGLKKRRESDNLIRDYISTIDDLTTQILIKQDKISNLNAKVREMIRNQFNSSDYLYTRYYEQIDDSRKAEHVYRIVRNQLKEFTNTKNLQHIDELLDEAFDGIMSKLLSSGLEFKEKDLLLIRFALAGFSAKSIAALLDESHQNINQRKKRMLDKIQIQAPKLMDELRMALNIKQINALPTISA